MQYVSDLDGFGLSRTAIPGNIYKRLLFLPTISVLYFFLHWSMLFGPLSSAKVLDYLDIVMKLFTENE